MQTWKDALAKEKQQPYFQNILETIKKERESGQIIYPPAHQTFTAFKQTEFNKVKVVILGQDPYHGASMAHGLAFSVQPNIKIPPSLANIYKELAQDIQGFIPPQHGCLTNWANQGVLLLNTVLTVRANQANSHANIGWEIFTDKVIKELNDHRNNLVFILWGSHAQKKGAHIDKNRHHIIKSAHPSPLSAYRGFFGSKPFSKTNDYLKARGIEPINWQI